MHVMLYIRCSECLECPVCDQLLLTRATTIQVPSPEDSSKMISKKMFYLVCGFCRWTTREAGLPDQPVGNIVYKCLLNNLINILIFL